VAGIQQGDPLIHIRDESTGKDLLKYVPEPKQWQFHLSDTPNLLIGGVRGTGKSLCMRMDAHYRALTNPGFAYLILRRKFPDLLNSHITHLDREMRAISGYYNKTEKRAYYHNGSFGVFGHCENERDADNYLSAEYGAIYFDELVTFSLDMFHRISGSARVTEDKPYTAIVRAGTNPGGEFEEWVKQWFVDKSVNLREFQTYDPDLYEYIHTVRADNPHQGDEYYKRLGQMQPHLRRQWLLGEWGVTEDGYFPDFKPWTDEEGAEPQEWHVISRLPTVKGASLLDQPWINVYRAVDWGFHPDPAVCLWIAVLPNKRAIVFKERTWRQTTAQEVAKDIVRESEGMRIVDTFADPYMWIDGKRQGVSYADYYEINGVPLTQSKNDRKAIGLAIHEWLNTVIDEQPKLQIYREGCPSLIRTLPQMRADKADPVRIADGDDHWTIALGYFCMSDVVASREPSTLGSLPRWMSRKPSPLNRYAIR